MTNNPTCIKCNRNDATGEWVGTDGEVMATCHGLNRPEHPGRRVTWRVTTGEEFKPADPQVHKFTEVFMRGKAHSFRGYPAEFLHERCLVVKTAALDLGDIFGTEFGLKDWAQEREDNGFFISALPLRFGAKVTGVQFRAFKAKTGDGEGGQENTRTIGKDGVYAPLRPGNNVEAAVVHEGPWGAISQLWDAKDYGASNLAALAAASAGTSAGVVKTTCDLLLPCVPIFILADNDEAGWSMRYRLRDVGILLSMPPVGDGKDYRDLPAYLRYEMLAQEVNRLLKAPDPPGAVGAPPGEKELDARLTGEARTEFGLANRFIARYGQSCRYVEGWNKWMSYNGKVWEVSNSTATLNAIKTINRLLHEANYLD